MKTKLLLNAILLVVVLFVSATKILYAQSCAQCTYVVSASGTYDNDFLGLDPGSIICIQAKIGGYTTSTADQTFVFKNFTSETDPFIFRNCGGQVIVKNTRQKFNNFSQQYEPVGTGISFDNCKNFRLTGTGDSGVEYGILVEGQLVVNGLNGPKWGVRIGGRSTDVEVDKVKVTNVLFAGFDIKTDPDDNRPVNSCDTLSWRDHFTMRNVFIHHNWVSFTQRGEGFYIGFTAYSDTVSCNFTKTVDGQTIAYTRKGFGHDIKGIRVYENIVEWSASDGIQVGSANEDCEVHDNIVTNYGHNPIGGGTGPHDNGIQLGDGTAGLCYNNFIKAPDDIEVASGIKVFGINNVLFNNIIINNDRKAIYIDDRPGGATGAGSGYKIYNNTIINTGEEGIYTANEKVAYHRIKNNIIIKASGTGYIGKGSTVPPLDQSNNYTHSSVSSAQFVNSSADDYHLSGSSPCINGGVNLYSEGVTFDFDNSGRPASGEFEQGAFEYGNPAACEGGGLITREYWTNVSGSTVADVPEDTEPTGSGTLTSFQAPTNIGTNYAARVRGYICPPVTGEYIFWIASNDHSELRLSTDDNPANKQPIAWVTGATDPLEFDKFPSQRSDTMLLTAGQKYYIEALHKQGAGTDHLTVRWQLPDETIQEPIPGNHLFPFTGPPAGCTATGTILREYWQGIQGSQVSLVPTTTQPDGSEMLTIFQHSNGEINYGARISGYICAPATGYYSFWISSNDHSELWLSTDDDPVNKQKIAYLSHGLSTLDWDNDPTQRSDSIHLVAGQRYYIEALHKQGIGTDHVAVGWQLPNGTFERPIPGMRLSPFEPAGGFSARMASSGDDDVKYLRTEEAGRAADESYIIQVYNAHGRYLNSVDVIMPYDDLMHLDFRQYTSQKGFYIFRIMRSDGKVVSKKMILNE